MRESGPLQALIDLRVRDEDGGEPVRAADVEGFGVMTRPHTMYTYFRAAPRGLPGSLSRAGHAADGGALEPERHDRGTLGRDPHRESVARDRPHSAYRAGEAAAAPAAPILVGSVRYVVTSREVGDMVVLWVHGIAATGWILGLLLLLASATAGSGSLAPEARRRLARW